MNLRQEAFYRQACSDWSVFQHFRAHAATLRVVRRRGRNRMITGAVVSFPPCHELHYLQMGTEKLAKAYYPAPPRGHAAFRQFVRDLSSNLGVLVPLGFADLAALTRWQLSVSRIVGAVEDLAPQLADARGLPNLEYPWPRGAEAAAPADYSFQAEVFAFLDHQARSGEPPFLTILGRMVATIRRDAWHL